MVVWSTVMSLGNGGLDGGIVGAMVFDQAAWLRFVGRLHPLVVHFPIALLLVAALLEIARTVRRRTDRPPGPGPATMTCLAFGAVGGAAAAFSGWTLAESVGGDEADLHRWLGVAASGIAIVALLSGVAARRSTRMTTIYRLTILLTAGLVGAAGHFGGSLVHGSGYLLGAFRAPVSDDPVVRTSLINTMPTAVETRCLDCHGPERQKGGVRFDTAAGLLAIGSNGPIITPGDPDESELVRRIQLPPDDPGMMPKGDEPLSAEEIAAIRAWIAGASAAGPSEPTEPLATDDHSTIDADARDAALERLRDAGVFAMRLAASSPHVLVRFDLAERPATDADLDLLRGLETSLVDLNLNGAELSDAGLARLESFEALERLSLAEASISAAGLPSLARLPRLRVLNLRATSADDEAIAGLASAPGLEQVVVWGTSVTADGAAALRGARPELEIIGAPGPE